MKTEQKKKPPISNEKVFRIMFIITLAVSGVFFVKNLLGQNVAEALIIGGAILVFAGIFMILSAKKAKDWSKQLTIAVGLLCMVFIIALNSGGYYSDDFIMFLAVIALTGLYLEPRFTMVQTVIAIVFLIIMYVVHPEKADPMGQYIQCLAEFALAAVLFGQTIKRGRAYIGIGEERAEESEKLMDSMRDMGEELEHDFAQSAGRIDNNTQELKRGSTSIVDSANNMNDSCNDVQDCMQLSQQSIEDLNEAVTQFEMALRENRSNVENMEKQLETVSDTILRANEVFQTMENKMNQVADIAKQLSDISFNTSILSLNASIEAARAGTYGAGFDVVATEMRDLSNSSNNFSEQVADVVKELLEEVEQTAKQFSDSTAALDESKTTMAELQASFGRLTNQFDSLYDNIENQTNNVEQVGMIFGDLKQRVSEMHRYSEDNQEAVEAIIDAMETYKGNINKVIENTRRM